MAIIMPHAPQPPKRWWFYFPGVPLGNSTFPDLTTSKRMVGEYGAMGIYL